MRGYLKDVPQPLTTDYVYKYWTESQGFTNPYLDGVLADEFFRGVGEDFPAYTKAAKQIGREARFRDKAVHMWCGPMYGDALATDFARRVTESGYKIAWEVCLAERPTAEETRKHFETEVRKMMQGWESIIPDFASHLIFVLGILCAPPESLNVDPHVDYKVFLDMQYQQLATAPEYAGLYGIMVYKSRYADEESVRWCGRLFRHYGIEGNTDLLSDRYGYRYRLDHIKNGDFDNGLDGWSVSAAEPGSMEVVEAEGVGHLIGRYAAPEGTGDRFLRMRRSAKAPNVLSQEIRNLRPGRQYALKLMVTDHHNVLQGKIQPESFGLSVKIGNVYPIPGKSITAGHTGIYPVGPFEGKGNGPWYNNHRWVFIAKEPTAQLVLSDWAGEQEPGGPVGQELIMNFIEVQPYFEEGPEPAATAE